MTFTFKQYGCFTGLNSISGDYKYDLVSKELLWDKDLPIDTKNNIFMFKTVAEFKEHMRRLKEDPEYKIEFEKNNQHKTLYYFKVFQTKVLIKGEVRRTDILSY